MTRKYPITIILKPYYGNAVRAGETGRQNKLSCFPHTIAAMAGQSAVHASWPLSGASISDLRSAGHKPRFTGRHSWDMRYVIYEDISDVYLKLPIWPPPVDEACLFGQTRIADARHTCQGIKESQRWEVHASVSVTGYGPKAFTLPHESYHFRCT